MPESDNQPTPYPEPPKEEDLHYQTPEAYYQQLLEQETLNPHARIIWKVIHYMAIAVGLLFVAIVLSMIVAVVRGCLHL